MPGQPPFTRGALPGGYRAKLWTMRQYAGFSTARDSNRRYRFLLSQGQTGLSVAFDLPTQIGYDSDHLLARGEVGKVGVPVASLEDMETLLDGIPLDAVSVSMTINATASILLALLLAVARGRGTPWSKLSGTIQNDILKEYAARGTYAFPPKPSLRLVTIETRRDLTRQMEQWARRRMRELERENLSGFIFKTRSPSCGMREVPICDPNGVQRASGIGIFARQLMASYPLMPVEDEERLHDPAVQEQFIERVLEYAASPMEER